MSVTRDGVVLSGHSHTTRVGFTASGAGNQGRNVRVKPVCTGASWPVREIDSTPSTITSLVSSDSGSAESGTLMLNEAAAPGCSEAVTSVRVRSIATPVLPAVPARIGAISARLRTGVGETRSRTCTSRTTAPVELVTTPLIARSSPGLRHDRSEAGQRHGDAGGHVDGRGQPGHRRGCGGGSRGGGQAGEQRAGRGGDEQREPSAGRGAGGRHPAVPGVAPCSSSTSGTRATRRRSSAYARRAGTSSSGTQATSTTSTSSSESSPPSASSR